MKKLLIIALCSLMLAGCQSEQTVDTGAGAENLIMIDSYLYYDSSTLIVYWWNNSALMMSGAVMPTAYYAPNGLPYKWNPQTKELEETYDAMKGVY